MCFIRKIIKNDTGSAIVEVAIILPLLLGLFMGLVYFTNSMRYQLIISMAAKEGARAYQASDGNMGVAINKARQELSIGNVKDAQVYRQGNAIIVSKPYGFYLPYYDRYLINIRAKHSFMEEIEDRYYQEEW